MIGYLAPLFLLVGLIAMGLSVAYWVRNLVTYDDSRRRDALVLGAIALAFLVLGGGLLMLVQSTGGLLRGLAAVLVLVGAGGLLAGTGLLCLSPIRTGLLPGAQSILTGSVLILVFGFGLMALSRLL